jgi:sarcosine/dimethylglycine N-methyltransferase
MSNTEAVPMRKEIERTAIPHQIIRLDIPIQQSYDDFIRAFESAVPVWSKDRSIELIARKAPWSDVAAETAAFATHDFLLYAKLDLAPMMSLAGNRRRATEYLMGNHVIAETMYRHEPAVALYVPLRLAIYESGEGTRFTIEQPSTSLSSLGRDEILEVGKDLDRKLAKLFQVLGVEVPDSLAEVTPSPQASAVAGHYGAPGLTERLKAALAALGPGNQQLTPQQLGAIDQFHTRGLAATAELARLAGITTDAAVLDVGSGLGGPARFLAATYGCRVTGIDLSEPFVDAAHYLTERTGQSGQVSSQTGSALALPFADGSFDVALLQHVAMNIADRAGLYREIRRVLKTGGKFATFDVVLNSGEPPYPLPHYPLPWARTPATSFLLTAAATREAIEPAGFRTLAWQDDTEAAKAWFTQLREAGPPPTPNLGTVMGPDMAQLAANLGRSLMEGRLGILTAVFEAA